MSMRKEKLRRKKKVAVAAKSRAELLASGHKRVEVIMAPAPYADLESVCARDKSTKTAAMESAITHYRKVTK